MPFAANLSGMMSSEFPQVILRHGDARCPIREMYENTRDVQTYCQELICSDRYAKFK